MELKVLTRKWGSSLGIIIPKVVVDENKIGENEEIVIEIRKPLLVKEVFGMIKGWKRPTQEIKDEMRKGWD